MPLFKDLVTGTFPAAPTGLFGPITKDSTPFGGLTPIEPKEGLFARLARSWAQGRQEGKEQQRQIQEFGKAVIRAPGRALTSVGLQPAADILSLIQKQKVKAEYQPKNKFERMVFGDEPIKGIFQQEQDAEEFIKDVLSQKIGMNPDQATGIALGLAPLFIAGMVAADITPVGGAEKQAGKKLVERELSQTIRGTKGLTAEQITQKHPDIVLKRDVPATDIYGNKVKIPEGEALTPYEMKGNKVLLQDGETYIVSKNQYQNIKGNAVSGEAKEFAPELKGTEETIKGDNKTADLEKQAYEFRAQGDIARGTELFREAQDLRNNPKKGDTKFSQYQLPEGKNYKEILIKAPEGTKKIGVKNSYNNDTFFTAPADTFKSSHWDEPNVISHLRLNERTYKGKKVTFMEELQSDWAREGRSKGFATDITKDSAKQQGFTVYKAESSTGGEAYFIDNPTDQYHYRKGFGSIGFDTEAQAWDSIVKKLKETNGAVPNNPLLKNWQELSVKRALKEAVDNNSEYLAWTTGEQQVARYNLLLKDITNVKEVGGKIEAVAGGQKTTLNTAQETELRKLLGTRETELKNGIDLKENPLTIDGQWARNLYGENLNGKERGQVKNIVEDITGHKVEVIDMGLPIDKKTETLRLGTDAFKPLKSSDLKVGQEFNKGIRDSQYIITGIMGEGKFEAVAKSELDEHLSTSDALKKIKNTQADLIKTFDISTKKSTGQQAIKIDDSIRSLVRGESPKLKHPSGINPLK